MRTGKRLFLLLLLIGSVVAREPGATGDLSLQSLREEISTHLGQERFSSAVWGVKVISLESSKTIFETNALKLLKPASNAKLFTGALALDRFGPDYRIKTSILSKSEPDNDGVIHGDLIIYGRGDFSFAARFRDGDYAHILQPIVDAIKKANIHLVEGDLIGDETYFRGPRLGSSWAWDDLQYYYGAEVSALTIQDNVIDLFFKPDAELNAHCTFEQKPETDFVYFVNRTKTTATNITADIQINRSLGKNEAYLSGSLPLNHGTWTDAVTVANPGLWFVTMLKASLANEGVEVKGVTGTKAWLEEQPTKTGNYKELGVVESAPLQDLISKMMKPSQNLYAQLLLLQVGANAAETNTETKTTEELGLAELRKFLGKANIAGKEVLLDEGSGLSRTALVTPNAIVQLLKYMHQHQNAALFRGFLPDAGTDGSLRNRLAELKGKLAAKTGTIRYVNCLSGYMTSRAGESLAFSIILNAYNHEGPGSSTDDIDAITLLLGRLSERSSETSK